MNDNTSGVIECAKEELENLELQHPNRFEFLKMDLKQFISEFQSDNNNNPTSISTCPSLHTQESSNRKKRKKGSPGGDDEEAAGRANGFGKKRSKTDAILHRARQCLRKIQQFKTSF